MIPDVCFSKCFSYCQCHNSYYLYMHAVAFQAHLHEARQRVQCRMPATVVRYHCTCSTLKVDVQCAQGMCYGFRSLVNSVIFIILK